MLSMIPIELCSSIHLLSILTSIILLIPSFIKPPCQHSYTLSWVCICIGLQGTVSWKNIVGKLLISFITFCQSKHLKCSKNGCKENKINLLENGSFLSVLQDSSKWSSRTRKNSPHFWPISYDKELPTFFMQPSAYWRKVDLHKWMNWPFKEQDFHTLKNIN